MNQQCSFPLFGSNLQQTLTTIAMGLLILTQVAFGADVKIPEIQAAAEKGQVSQEIELAGDYYFGHGVPQNLKMAAYWYEKAAASGDPEAANAIGYFYQTGTGVKADPERAFHWYQLSAASGLAPAKVNMGVSYLRGLGVRKDAAIAAQLFREAAGNGCGIAATYLGNLYYFGIGISQDKIAAEHWFETGVKLHDPLAAFNLGMLFFDIHDHPQDFPKAAKLLREAATAGYVPGMYSLGLLLTKHPELAKSPHEALTLLETAANSGSWKSSVILGIVARDGRGGPIDLANAYFHFQVAILQGGAPARQLLAFDLSKLSAQLTAEQARGLAENANTWFQARQLSLDFVDKDGLNSKRFQVLGIAANDEGVHGAQLLLPPPT